jgi:Right handed beta helix region
MMLLRISLIAASLLVLSCAHRDEPNVPSAPDPPTTVVPVHPGQSIQAAVTAHSPATTFLILAGRHVRQSVEPKSENIFRCEPGAVLDGEMVTPYAFAKGKAPYPGNVQIVGCRITRYTPPSQMGAITASGYTASDGATGWVVDSCEVDHNSSVGIRLGHRMRVRGSNIHHNGQLGLSGVGDSILVESTEVAYNNPTAVGFGFEAGGTKFVLTTGLVLRNNFVHHNQGPGLWTDIDNDGYLIERNRVEDNLQEGIVTEVSYLGVIRDNTVRRNGLEDSRRTVWLWGAGIAIVASSNVEVSGNILEGNAHGIVAIQQTRGSGRLGPYVVQNLWVHDNSVTQSSGMTGAVQDVGELAIFTERNNRFDRNTYRISGNGRPFAWLNGPRTEEEWKFYGHDLNGTFTR